MNIESIKNECPQQGLEPFVKGFLADRCDESEELAVFLSKSDFEQIKSLAHKWKGFSLPYGFKLLGELSIDLELAAKQSDLGQCELLVQDIKKYLEIKKSLIS